MNIEELIRDFDDQYKRIFYYSPVGLWISDFNGNIIEMNKKMLEVIGYDLEEIKKINLNNIYLNPEENQQTLKQLANGKKMENIEVKLKKRSGEIYWARLTTNVINILGQNLILAYCEDITKKKKLEENLRKSQKILKHNEQVLRNYFNAIQDGISILDRDLNIIRVNAWMKKMYSSEEPLVGKKCYSAYQKRDSICPWCPSIKAFETGEPYSEIVPYPSKNDPTGWIDLSAFPIKDNNGEVINVIEYVKNITKLMETQKRLKTSEQELRDTYNRAEFYKDLFVHDIKNMLQTILIGIEIKESFLNPSMKKNTIIDSISLIKEQVLRGAQLVSNIMKFSELDDVEFSLRRIRVHEYLQESISYIMETQPNKEINIKINSSTKDIYIKGNEFIVDIFNNILFNAIQHNENLNIEIGIKIFREKTDKGNYIRFEFKDNGFGIRNDRKKEIFLRGYKQNRIIQGSGLGLALVSSIINKFNGKIWVEDRIKGDYSKGSNFIILIPEG